MRVIAILVPLSLALAGCSSGADSRGLGRDETLLKVSATGEAQARPDRAKISAGVESYGTTAQEAASANNATMNKILAAIEAQGVAKDDIQTRNMSLDRSYYDSSKRRYVASNTVSILARKIDDASKIVAAATGAGANNISGPEMIVSDPEAVNRGAITAAYKAARTRADAYAKATGLRVIRIVTIQDGQEDNLVAYVAADAAEELAPSALPPIRSGMNSTTARVQIDFALAP